MIDIYNLNLWNNSLYEYTIALGIFLISLFILKIIKTVIIHKLHSLAKKTKNDIDDMIMSIINDIHWPFYGLISLYIGLQFLTLSDKFINGLKYAILIFIAYYTIKTINSLIDYAAKKQIKKNPEQGKSGVNFFKNTLKIGVWIIGVGFLISNLGYNITSIVTGLGIGGIAIALAVQNVLQDLFASVSIFFDKPFQEGDYISVGGDSGTVKKIGIKTTRIKTLQGEELIISNKELTSARIQNFKKMNSRRISFDIGVVYGTSPKKLEKIPSIIEKIITDAKDCDFSRCHFKSFGDFSLNFNTVYIMKTKEFDKYMDTQQEINLAITKAFAKEKIDMAFPTQTIILEK